MLHIRVPSDVVSEQVFAQYGRPYTLPIPAGVQPSAVTTAPNVSYPDVGSGGLIALAGVPANFSLRFSGERVLLASHSLSH